MAADSSGFVSGHYLATWNALDLGRTEIGFKIRPNYHIEPIRDDAYGDAVVDGIYRGYDLFIDFDLTLWTAAERQNFQYAFDGGTPGTIQGVGQTIVGSFAKQLILTPVSGINSNNATYTFPLTAPEPGHGEFDLNTKWRRLKCRLKVYPALSTGVLFTSSGGSA